MPPPGYERAIRVTIGDDKDITWEVTHVPIGQYITRAWFTLKREADIGLPDSSAVIPQKIITDTAITGIGVITASGLGTKKAKGKFELVASESATLTPGQSYLFDIQLESNLNKRVTVQKGHLDVGIQVTEA